MGFRHPVFESVDNQRTGSCFREEEEGEGEEDQEDGGGERAHRGALQTMSCYPTFKQQRRAQLPTVNTNVSKKKKGLMP